MIRLTLFNSIQRSKWERRVNPISDQGADRLSLEEDTFLGGAAAPSWPLPREKNQPLHASLH